MSEAPEHWAAEIETQVQFFDLDPMEVVWHGHYVKYLEIARCALLDRIGYNYQQMKASGYAWPVIDLHIRYASPATFGQRLKLRSEIVEWENRQDPVFNHRCRTGRRLSRARRSGRCRRRVGDVVSPPVLFEKLGVSPGMKRLGLGFCGWFLSLGAAPVAKYKCIGETQDSLRRLRTE
jgi:acyl-CoA thioester hydrolase